MRLKQLRNIIGFSLGRLYPVYAHYGLTHKCNLSCYMCKVKEDIGHEELSLKEIRFLTENLASKGIVYVSIGGGEPLVRDDIVGVIKIFKQHSIRVRLLTNGVLLNRELLIKLKEAGLSDISISLDTLDKNKCNLITGSDCFNKVINSISLIGQHFNRGINLINVVISKYNIDELSNLVEFAKKHRFKISLIPIEGAENSFTSADRLKIETVVNALDRKALFNSNEFLNHMIDYLCGEFKMGGCFAGKLYISISPSGDISPCHMYNFNDADWQIELKSCSGCMRPCWKEIDYLYTQPINRLKLASKHLGSYIT